MYSNGDASVSSVMTKQGVEEERSYFAYESPSHRTLHNRKKKQKLEKNDRVRYHSKDDRFNREKMVHSRSGSKRPRASSVTPSSNATSARHEHDNEPSIQRIISGASNHTCEISVELKSTTFMTDKTYINIFIDTYGYSNTINDNSDDSNSQARLSPMISGIYKVLIDVMEFHPYSAENIFDLQPMPDHMDSVQTVASVNDFIMLQISSSNLNPHTSCHIMEEIFLAFRLAVHNVLKATDVEKMTDKISSNILLEAKSRGLVTLLKSLRRLFGSILDYSCQLESSDPLKKNIVGFFCLEWECYFSRAQMLLLDIVPLLTDGNASSRAVKGKTFQFVIENLLKLDSVSICRKMRLKGFDVPWDFNDGLIEMFIRQILFNDIDGSIRKMLEKISKNQPNSVAYCSTTNEISEKCYQAMLQVTKVRRSQLERIHGISNSSEVDKINHMTFEGCSFISEIVCRMRSSSLSYTPGRRLELFLDELRQNDGLSQMTFHLFHTIMDHGIVVPHQECTTIFGRKDRLLAASIASLLLSSKSFDCPFPIKGMIQMIAYIEADAGVDDSSVTMLEDQIKVYEFQLLSSLGFELPSLQSLPYSYIHDVIGTLDLNPSFSDILKDIFDDKGFTHSKLLLMNDMKLVAFAAYHYACIQGLCELSSNWESKLSKRDVYVINMMSSYMKQLNLYLQNIKRCIDTMAPLEAPSLTHVLAINDEMI